MKKRIIAVLFATTMICGLITACGGNTNNPNNQTEMENNQSQSETAEGLYELHKEEIGSIHDGSKLIIMELKEDRGIGLFSIHEEKDNLGYKIKLFTPKGGVSELTVIKNFEYCTHCGMIKLIDSTEKFGLLSYYHGYDKENSIVLLGQEMIYLDKETLAETSRDYIIIEPDTLNMNVVQKEEFAPLIENCEFVPIDENSTWYTDVDSAFENRIIIQ